MFYVSSKIERKEMKKIFLWLAAAGLHFQVCVSNKLLVILMNYVAAQLRFNTAHSTINLRYTRYNNSHKSLLFMQLHCLGKKMHQHISH